jgi:hypothetical protein
MICGKLFLTLHETLADRARRFGNALIDKALSIGAFPEMGSLFEQRP